MRQLVIYLVPTFVFAFLLIYFIKPISHWLGGLIYSSEVEAHLVVAGVEGLKGHAFVRKNKEEKYLSLESKQEIYNYDRIRVGHRSQLTLAFPFSGYTLEFSQDSEFVIEVGGERPQAVTSIYFQRGTSKMIKAGKKGRLYIFKDGRRLTPEQKMLPRQLLEVKPTLVQGGKATGSSKPSKKESDSKSGGKPGLTDRYVEERIGKKRSLFENCLANSLRDDGVAGGDILVGFSILPTGHVTNVQAVKSQLTSENLERCVLDVFKRTRFKSFKGDIIEFSYPLKFN